MVAAFPGAEGGGATATGGRGGRTIVVRNTNATGDGSLYAALMENGTRTIIFQISGIIDWSSVGSVKVTSGDLTVAGQTSPGFGILIKNGNIELQASNIIIRYITMRCGKGSNNGDIITTYGSRQILDHVSISWANNDMWGIWNYGYPNRNTDDITLQWSIVSESFAPPNDPWNLAYHPTLINVGAEGRPNHPEESPYFYNTSIHHNLLSQTNERMPQVKSADASIVNNIIYNSYSIMSMFSGGGTFDFIGNRYKNNILTTRQKEIAGQTKNGVDDMGLPGDPSVYVSNNMNMSGIVPSDQWGMVSGNWYSPTSAPSSWKRNPWIPNTPDIYPITIDSVSDIDSIVLPTVGNSRYIDANGNWVNRNDVVDARYIKDYKNGTGKTPTHQNDVGGYPTYYPTTPYTDSNSDGISDVWAAANGINTSNPANKIAANGYSNLENFINGEHSLTCPKSECNFTITQ